MRKKCKGIGEVTIMEVSDVDLVGVTPTKKRKIYDGNVKLSPTLLRFRSISDVLADTPASSVNSKENNYASSEPTLSSKSCCSRNSKSLDLDDNGMEVIVASRENTRMTKMAKHENSRCRISPEKMAKHENSCRRIMPEENPSRNDIEEFFAACEKDMFKRFREKYNFDLEKEEPLEGRYEWVQRIGT